MEADGFAGQALEHNATRDRLVDDLATYDAAMGIVNRDLVLTHHKARDHAHELVGVFRSLAPLAEPAATPGGELARHVRLRWAADRELHVVRAGTHTAPIERPAEITEAIADFLRRRVSPP